MSGKREASLSMTRMCSGLTVIHSELVIKEQRYTSGAAVGLTLLLKKLWMILRGFGISLELKNNNHFERRLL